MQINTNTPGDTNINLTRSHSDFSGWAADRKAFQVLRGHSDAIACLVTDESLDLVFSAGEDLVVIAWQLESSSPLFRISSEATTVRSLLLLPGHQLICCEATVATIWNFSNTESVIAGREAKAVQEVKTEAKAESSGEGEETLSNIGDNGSMQCCFKVRVIEICDVDNEATCACLWPPNACSDSLPTDATSSASIGNAPGLSFPSFGLLIGTANGLIKKFDLSA